MTVIYNQARTAAPIAEDMKMTNIAHTLLSVPEIVLLQRYQCDSHT